MSMTVKMFEQAQTVQEVLLELIFAVERRQVADAFVEAQLRCRPMTLYRHPLFPGAVFTLNMGFVAHTAAAALN